MTKKMLMDRVAEVFSVRKLREFRADDSGATSIEYGLIAALLSIAIMASVRAYTTTTSSMYDGITTTIGDSISNQINFVLKTS